MKYSSNYGKLYKPYYTTIRRYSKGKMGDFVKEIYPNGVHSAQILRVERKTLNEITTEFLLADTDCKTRKEAIRLIESFYKKPIDRQREKLYIYYLQKIKYKRK